MKKLISIVLCMAMLLSCFALFASAVQEAEPTSQSLAEAPTIDGVVDPEEYTTSKEWSHEDNFANKSAITSGYTLTEYVSHSNEYVYIAFVSTEDVSKFQFYLNASEYILTDFDQCGITSNLLFDLSAKDEDTAPTVSYDRHLKVSTENSLPVTLRGLAEGEYEAIAKRNKDGDVFTNVTVEIKISKAAMKAIFDADSLDMFGYYVDGTKADGSGNYVNSRKFTGTTTYTKFSSITQFETDYSVNRGTYYADQSRVLNFVIFGEEPAPYHYCPAADSCTDSKHAERSATFSLTDITQWNQLPSTYVSTKVIETQVKPIPVLDGSASITEYTTSKVWNDDSERFAGSNAISSGKTLTEYAAHDADYIYIAFVSTEDVSNFTLYLNARDEILTDFNQCGVTSTLSFNLDGQDVTTTATAGKSEHTTVPEESKFTPLRGLKEGEYEAIAKRNYNGGSFENVTVEIMIHKSAIKSVFGVDSVDMFGYYVDGTKADGSGHYINSRKFTGTTTYTKFSSITQFETDYSVNRGTYYANQSRVLNFVIFDEEPAPYHYCPAADSCTDSKHTERSATFSLTDITQWNQLPSTYVTSMIQAPENTETSVDGTVDAEEYDTEKVWSHQDHFQNGGAITDGKTLTEYVTHDADYIYIAFVSTEDVSELTFCLNASESILTDFGQCGATSTLNFNLDGRDVTTAPMPGKREHKAVASTYAALKRSEFEAIAKRNYNGENFENVTVEIKISKAAMENIFGVDSVEYFGYYVDAQKVGGGSYVNTRKFTGTTTYTKFSSINEFEQDYVDRGAYYDDQGRVLNFVIFDEEPAPVHYCPARADCSDPKHGERTETFSLADITQWNQLPSTYLATMRGEVDEPGNEPGGDEPVIPDEPTTPPEPSSTPVRGTYVEGATSVDTYSVDVVFGAMQFTYRAPDKKWDTSAHEEVDIEGSDSWTCDTDANKITVTNHSNIGVKATLSYAQESGQTSVTGSFGNKSVLTLDSAVGTTYAQAPNDSAYLTLDGTYSGAEDSFVKVGTVTVTITKAE